MLIGIHLINELYDVFVVFMLMKTNEFMVGFLSIFDNQCSQKTAFHLILSTLGSESNEIGFPDGVQ